MHRTSVSEARIVVTLLISFYFSKKHLAATGPLQRTLFGAVVLVSIYVLPAHLLVPGAPPNRSRSSSSSLSLGVTIKGHLHQPLLFFPETLIYPFALSFFYFHQRCLICSIPPSSFDMVLGHRFPKIIFRHL